ncbi:MAG TPA: helix-turn-helix domain-containing protein [Roseiarcus sp.]|nr:helix-turn-helix domain-containing protein [Roseiarcus sp.]
MNGGNAVKSDETSDPKTESHRQGQATGATDGRRAGDAAAARRRYLFEGVAPGPVPAPILRSWRRSAAYGLNMGAKPALDILTRHRLREAQQRNETLVRAARGEMETLFRDARVASGIVILTDPHGLILHRLGEGKFASEAANVALLAGATWDEATAGTNAIGAALAERAPGAVIGGEHFFEIHNILSCSAAPIFDPFGAVAGVLDLTSSSSEPQPLMLALVNRAAEQIEHALFENQFRGFEQMRFHSDPYVIGSPHEGILAFDGDRVAGANRNGVALLGLEWPARRTLRFDELFSLEHGEVSHNPASDDCVVETKAGQRLFARMRLSPRVYRGWSPDAAVRVETRALTLPQILERVLAGPLAPLVKIRRIKTGQLIYGDDQEKVAEDGLVIVRSGRLRCFASVDGKELTLFTLDAGDALPLHASSMFEVKKDGEVVVLSGKAYQDIMQSDADLARSAMPAMSRMLQRAMRMTEDIVFRCVRYRVVQALCEAAERDGRREEEGVVLDAPPSAEEFAMQIGATRQSVSTIIAELIRDSLIRRRDAAAIVIGDLDRLKHELA